MLVTKTTEYALRALVYLVSQGEGARVSAQQLAEATGAFPAFLAKIVQKLVRAGILVSKRGPTGGVSLARPPERIAILDVVTALEGKNFLRECVLGLEQCDAERPCPLHQDWLPIRDRIMELLRSRNLAELAARLHWGARLRREFVVEG